MTIYKGSGGKIIRSSSGQILKSSDAIVDIDIDYNYKLNGGDIEYMKNRVNPSQTAYQKTAARRFIYNATEDAAEGDTTSRELYLPYSDRYVGKTLQNWSMYFRFKLKETTADKYIMESADGGALEDALYFQGSTITLFGGGADYTFPDPTILTNDYVDLIYCSDDSLKVGVFVNGNLVKVSAPTLGSTIACNGKMVIYGNTRLGTLKFNGYFKAFKFWDKSIIKLDGIDPF